LNVFSVIFTKKLSLKKKLIKLFFVLCIVLGCEKPDSILKIYVKDTKGVLISDASVNIVSSYSAPVKMAPHLGKDNTDGLGVAVFNLNDFFNEQFSTSRDGYFDVSVTKETMKGEYTQVRATMNTTQVQTIYIK
jgi:hypothetical protein